MLDYIFGIKLIKNCSKFCMGKNKLNLNIMLELFELHYHLEFNTYKTRKAIMMKKNILNNPNFKILSTLLHLFS